VAIAVTNPDQLVEIPASRLFFVLLRASQATDAYATAAITTSGLYVGEFAVLEALLHKGPLTIDVIVTKTGLTSASIVPAVDRLATLGHLRVEGEWRGDHRTGRLELTSSGHALISEIYDRHAGDVERAMSPLSAAERVELYRLLKKIGLHSESLQLARYQDRPGSLSPSQLRRATRYLSRHSGVSLSVAEVAGNLGLSTAQFSRAFKAATGEPPHRWQLNLRIAKAQELLRYGAFPLAEIALATGFAEQSHFTRCFKKVVGVSPGAWRRAHRQ
jgi:AraC-like DNA-binding protein/DNA-binding MarR family transcriptional regulator